MSYSQPQRISYALGNQDFGASDDTYVIKGPANKRGKVVAIIALVTEVFTATTTPAKILIGTSADPDAYAILTFGTDAVDDVVQAGVVANTATKAVNLSDIEASSTGAEVHVDTIATTGGSPTGQAEVTVVIDWY